MSAQSCSFPLPARERRSAFAVPFGANPFLILAIIGAQGCHVAAMYLPGFNDVLGIQPISLGDWLLVAAVAVSLLAVMELWKAWLRRRPGGATVKKM